MGRKVITIDGLAGSGKSTLAKLLAEKLSYELLPSGLIYRTLALLAKRLHSKDVSVLVEKFQDSTFELKSGKVFFDGQEISAALYTPEISELTSQLAVQEELRKAILPLQRDYLPGNNLIAEGRDMGTVVFPDADLKLFLECPEEVLIERRIQQMAKNNSDFNDLDLEKQRQEMQKEISARNERDQQRQVSPTIPAKDAIIVDNSAKTLTELLDFVYSLATKV